MALVTSVAILVTAPASAQDPTPVDCGSEDLQNAVDAAPSGAILELVGTDACGDVTIDRALTIRRDGIDAGAEDILGTITILEPASVSLEGLSLGAAYGSRTVASSGDVTLRDVDIYGGGIALLAGRATLIDSVIDDSVEEFPLGGGIYSCGQLTMHNSRLTDNFATDGGGLYVACGSATLVDTLVSGGGASRGAGIYVSALGTLTMRDSKLLGNDAAMGGGLYVAGHAVVSDTTIANNRAQHGDTRGGGIANSGTLEIVNSTLSGNKADVAGGGLAIIVAEDGSQPATSLRHTTITANEAGVTAGGLADTANGTLDIFGSIIAGNTSSGQPDVDVSGNSIMTSAYNVYGDCCDFTWSPTDLVDVANPSLAALADNGGPTRTHALLAGAPAIDLIPPDQCDQSEDQRGARRPHGEGCDSGSFEHRTIDDLSDFAAAARFSAKTKWRSVEFATPFAEPPIVVVGPASLKGSQGVTTRIANTTTTGFETRLKEWRYLDGNHTFERLSYLAVPPGRHELASGSVVEAGTSWVWTGGREVAFAAPFTEPPVVIATLVTDRGPALAIRAEVTSTGFSASLDAEEADSGSYTRVINWVAWSSGSDDGAEDGLAWETLHESIKHKWVHVGFDQQYGQSCLLASIDSNIGGDPANLRYRDLTNLAVELRLAEERSADNEIAHTFENIGLLVIECIGN